MLMYVSYSGFKTYEQCPYSYWHKYVNKTHLSTPDNGVNALFGTIVGTIFESFYRDRIWRHPDFLERLQGLVEPHYNNAIKSQRGRVYDWNDEKANYHSKEELLVDVWEALPRGVRIIKEHRLLGAQADPEVKLDTKFGNHIIGGRADFVIRRIEPHKDLVILDGKGSKHREKYVDGQPKKAGQEVEGTQLKWYGLLYRAKFSSIPDKIGYVFWRFEGDQAIEWVPFVPSDLDRLQHEVLTTMGRVETSISNLEGVSGQRKVYDELRQELFPAQPGGHCRFCVYASTCEEGSAKVKSFDRKRPPRATLPVDGVVDPGMSLDSIEDE